MKKILRTALAAALAGCMMVAAASAATASFSDVPNDQGVYSFVLRAAKEGLVSGTGNGKFGIGEAVTNAQFTAMVCNLICKDDVMTHYNTYKPAQWWYSYMAVAYSKGYLKDTTVGDARVANNAWSTSSVDAKITRYDMAQIMVNVANSEGWTMPSSQEILTIQLKIADWNKIPAKYQTAVATAYAKGFLSGMQDGTFSGGNAMLREHSAVVLCKLMDAKNASAVVTTPAYTNTTKLVNGKEATKANVIDALEALKSVFPQNTVWNANQVYISKVLGAAYGADAYAYTISDRVFGTFKATTVNVEDMKAGDLLYMDDLKCHVVVTEVDNNDFYYTGCSSNGKTYWNGSGEISTLGSKDKLYTRYEDASASNILSNGKSVTEENVKELIVDFLNDRDEYDVGDEWDRSFYRSFVMSEGNKVYGSEAFAYYVSDYVFGDLDVNYIDEDNVRAGDVVGLDDENEHIIVTEVRNGRVYFLGIDSDSKVYYDNLKLSALDNNDVVYTRYLGQAEDELTNGKSITQSNIQDLIDEFLYAECSEGTKWQATYTSAAFGHKSEKNGSEAFACYLSDYVFGSLEVDYLDDLNNLRAGDVIELFDEEKWIVVTKVSGDIIDYLGLNSRSKVSSGEMNIDNLDSDDWVYTRYPD